MKRAGTRNVFFFLLGLMVTNCQIARSRTLPHRVNYNFMWSAWDFLHWVVLKKYIFEITESSRSSRYYKAQRQGQIQVNWVWEGKIWNGCTLQRYVWTMVILEDVEVLLEFAKYLITQNVKQSTSTLRERRFSWTSGDPVAELASSSKIALQSSDFIFAQGHLVRTFLETTGRQ